MEYSYDTSKDTITVNGVEYDVHREPDRGHPEETLTLRDFDVDKDEFIDPFPGLEGTLGYEEYTEGMSPRDWSNVGTISVSYRGYDLGDEDISQIDFQRDCERCDGDGLREFTIGDRTITVTCAECQGNGWFEVSPVDYFKEQRGARVVLPLIVYEHSGITMRVGHVGDIMGDSAGWDTSFVGFTFDTPEKVKECMGDNVTDEEIEKALRQEIESYASYLEGDVTRYIVEDDETGYLDSCGGFVGDHKECERQCFEALCQAVVKRLAEQTERAEWNARGVETK